MVFVHRRMVREEEARGGRGLETEGFLSRGARVRAVVRKAMVVVVDLW